MTIENLVITKSIAAPIEHVYRAFTNSSAYREWMCDTCLADPRPRGRLYFGWNGPFYAAGEFTELETNHLVAFIWLGRGEPAQTWVKVTLTQQPSDVQLQLEHGGMGEGETWEKVRQMFQMSWDDSLVNLASVLETGRDLRITKRPMLGILIDQFNPEIAQRIGVPVTQGVRLAGVVEGMGAQAAGLQAEDVLVSMGKTELKDNNDLGIAIQSVRAGDEVELMFYRAKEKRTVQFKLSGRPIPEIPATAQELADTIEKSYAEIEPTLNKLFTGVSEAEASARPAENEWSAKEVLVHLIHTERFLQNTLAEIVSSAEATHDNYPENWNGRIQATLAVYPTVQALRDAYQKTIQEIICLFAALPPEFVARKSSYWRLVLNSSQLANHFKGHANQIQAALEKARKGRD